MRHVVLTGKPSPAKRRPVSKRTNERKEARPVSSLPAQAPGPNTATPTEVAFRELIRTLGMVERVMQPYFARFGITGAKWGVLRNLHRAEQGEGLGGLRLTDLSQRLLIRPPSVMGVLDRLERAGLVARLECAADRRTKRVRLTEKGRQLVERVLQVHRGQIEAVMGSLDRDEQDQLHRLLCKLREGMERLPP
jgi:DNA-binding MarR family transcriptional regulator